MLCSNTESRQMYFFLRTGEYCFFSLMDYQQSAKFEHLSTYRQHSVKHGCTQSSMSGEGREMRSGCVPVKSLTLLVILHSK